MKKYFLFISIILLIVFACSKKEGINPDDASNIDTQLFKYVSDTSNFDSYIWAKGNTINTDNSPHKGYFKLKFNKQALLSLDSFFYVMGKDSTGKDSILKDKKGKDSTQISQYRGELNPSNKFRDSSIIIQELYTNQDDKTPVSISVMMKTKHENTKDGYLWANYQLSDKKILYSATKEGQACASCHHKGSNRDLVRTFEGF